MTETVEFLKAGGGDVAEAREAEDEEDDSAVGTKKNGCFSNCGPHRRAARYSPIQCVLVVFHIFLSATPMTHTF